MAGDLQRDGVKFCQRIFDHVRSMSVDGIGVTRQGYSVTENDVIDYLKSIGVELGLEITTDAAGNVWMRMPGRDRSLPAVVAGSHTDSVPQGGNYDGLAGIVAALATAWWMRRINFVPQRDYVVLMMRCEESSFFGKAYVGSLAFTGQLTLADTALKHRTLDKTLGECMSECGFNPAEITAGKPLVDLSKIAAFIELHIEQGPTLDSSKTERVGIVTGIRGNVRHKVVKCIGQTAHSGAVDKQYRHDAVMATAELISRMDRHWDEWLEKGEDLVFTVGVLKTAATAAISVIPGETTFTVDMRGLKLDTVERFHELLLKEAQAVAEKRGVKFEFDKKLVTQPASVDEALSNRLAATAEKCGIPVRRLASGAGHDSAVIGNKGVPVAMIFVANQNGSHNPYEAMEIRDFMIGANLLWRTVEHYDQEL
ncbi:MAG TPA: Zn-dependent hydrolase [Sutterella sp.]|nr:Zn-dependent hydrolase [Sutterella sp.]